MDPWLKTVLTRATALLSIAIVGGALVSRRAPRARLGGALSPPAPAGGARRVLVAGFEAFLAHADNPAAAVARALDGTCAPAGEGDEGGAVCFDGWQLPVDGGGARAVAAFLDEDLRAARPTYAAVVHLGLEDLARGLRLEIAAANVAAVAADGARAAAGRPPLAGWSADVPCNKTATPYRDAVVSGPSGMKLSP